MDVSNVRELNEKSKLYFGRIKRIFKMGDGNPWNIQMTRLQYENDGDYQDFTLKMSIRDSKEHGITDASIGRIVMMYGPISKMEAV